MNVVKSSEALTWMACPISNPLWSQTWGRQRREHASCQQAMTQPSQVTLTKLQLEILYHEHDSLLHPAPCYFFFELGCQVCGCRSAVCRGRVSLKLDRLGPASSRKRRSGTSFFGQPSEALRAAWGARLKGVAVAAGGNNRCTHEEA